jgi:small nuclear ribonucleoprotein (snRNP)-like protein
MPNWKKVITSGSDAVLGRVDAHNNLYLHNVDTNNSEATALVINGSTNEVEKRELGSNAFNSNTYNNYSLPAGSSSTRGGFKIGFAESGRNYPVEVSSEKMYVNVPWVDTNTNTQLSDAQVRSKFSAGTNVSISAAGVISSTDTNTNTQLTTAQVRSKFSGNGINTSTGVITDTNTQLTTAQVRSKFTGGTNVSISATGVISSTDTNTNTQRSDAEIRNVTAAQLQAGDNVTLTVEGENITVSSTDTNTQLSTADVRGKFSAGANVTITDGVIASSFTNTNDDVSVANLKTRLAGGFGSNAVQIGDASDIVTIGNKLVVAGDLVVNGATTTVNTANLNIEDSFILLASGSAERVDAGIIFNSEADGTGDSFFYDSQSGRPSWAESVAFNATAVAPTAYIPRVYDLDAGMEPVAERGSIRVEGEEIFMYS